MKPSGRWTQKNAANWRGYFSRKILFFVQQNTRCASNAKITWLFCKVCRKCASVCSLCRKNKKAMKSFDFTAFSGAMEGTRTPGLLIRSQSLYPAELPTHTFRSEQDVFYHAGRGLSTVFCRFFDFIFVLYFSAQKSTYFQHFPCEPQASSARRSAMRTPVGVAARPPWPVSRRSGESRLPTRPMASMTSSQGMA